MALVKGPFTFKWGSQTLDNVSEISVDYTVDTSDTNTLDGRRHTVQTGMGMTVTLTLLENDIASLATILPQYFKANGETLSTGETVTQDDGAIDIAAASCGDDEYHYNLDVYACGTNAQVLRLVRARTQVDSIDIGDGLRTVSVMFVGEPVGTQGVVQLLQDDETFVS